MRTHSGKWLMSAGLAAFIAMNSPLPGAEPQAQDDATGGAAAAGQDGGQKNNDDGSPKKKERPAGSKDAVAAAFALPKGVVLNADQQAAYDELKSKYEGELSQAFDDVQSADGAAARAKALKEARETRKKIRAGIQEILAMPYRAAAEQAASQQPNNVPAPSFPGAGYVPQYNYGGYYPGAPGLYPYFGGGYPYQPYSPPSPSQSMKGTTSGQGGATPGASTTAGKTPSTTNGKTTSTTTPPKTTGGGMSSNPTPKPPAYPQPTPPPRPSRR